MTHFMNDFLCEQVNSWPLVMRSHLLLYRAKRMATRALVLCVGALTLLANDVQPTNHLVLNSEGFFVFFDTKSAQPKLFWAGTTDFFITDDGLLLTMEPETRGLVVQQDAIEAARRSKECRPAKDDPDGNWGPICDGLQMCIRFESDAVPMGQPVQASVILRNVTNEMRHLIMQVPPYDKLLELKVLDRSGTIVSRRREKTKGSFLENLQQVIQQSRPIVVRPGTQYIGKLEVRDFVDLSRASDYTVWATRRIPDPDRKRTNEVITGRAKIRIK